MSILSFLHKILAYAFTQTILDSEMEKIDSNFDQNESQVEENEYQIISKYLFTSDYDGCLKQWDIKKQKLMKDFGKIHSYMI